jgi:hypothetical protein
MFVKQRGKGYVRLHKVTKKKMRNRLQVLEIKGKVTQVTQVTHLLAQTFYIYNLVYF